VVVPGERPNRSATTTAGMSLTGLATTPSIPTAVTSDRIHPNASPRSTRYGMLCGMPTLHEYADQIAGNDTGLWRDTLHHVAELRSTSYWYDGPGTSPAQEVPFRAGALLIFALASERHITPTEIGVPEALAWLDEHPHQEWIDALTDLLTRAGYTLPPRRLRGGLPTGDPVVDTWAGLTFLVDRDAPDWGDTADGPWPDPLLPGGLSSWRPLPPPLPLSR
jgi:hypothetical protein